MKRPVSGGLAALVLMAGFVAVAMMPGRTEPSRVLRTEKLTEGLVVHWVEAFDVPRWGKVRVVRWVQHSGNSQGEVLIGMVRAGRRFSSGDVVSTNGAAVRLNTLAVFQCTEDQSSLKGLRCARGEIVWCMAAETEADIRYWESRTFGTWAVTENCRFAS